MNMKMEEQQDNKQESKKKDHRRNHNTRQSKQRVLRDGDDENAEESSVLSGEEAPSEYESMLQKYEAEVRNHIKIEQQLKLHIECVQDKLEDQEKLLRKEVSSKLKEQDESNLELKRYKDLLGLREKEIAQLKKETEQLRLRDLNHKK